MLEERLGRSTLHLESDSNTSRTTDLRDTLLESLVERFGLELRLTMTMNFSV
jgi:hypothetical protein